MGGSSFFSVRKVTGKRLQTDEIQVTLVETDVNGHGKKGVISSVSRLSL
ncbi:hypothetical protein N624_0606 [Levilactobacillus brevis]|nr:hypothetical protein N624_0606 [Levilactobacillus brevis]